LIFFFDFLAHLQVFFSTSHSLTLVMSHRWSAAATALAVASSVANVYLYQQVNAERVKQDWNKQYLSNAYKKWNGDVVQHRRVAFEEGVLVTCSKVASMGGGVTREKLDKIREDSIRQGPTMPYLHNAAPQ
jgi:hypothetical protein